MFVKKFLGIIALVFASSYISTVSADCKPTYTEKDGCVVDSCEDAEFGYYYATDTLVKVTAADSCEKVETAGFYVTKDGSYYSVNSSKITAGVSSNENCSKAGAGNFETTNKHFCLTNNKELTLNDGKSYMFTDSGNIFTNGGSDNVVIKSDAESITINTDYMVNYNLCVDEDLVVWERKKALCNAETDCTYYNCNDGQTCTEIEENIDPNDEVSIIKKEDEDESCDLDTAANCEEGYYIIEKDDTEKALINSPSYKNEKEEDVDYEYGEVDLYLCEKDDKEVLKCTKQDVVPGYLVNSGNGKGTASFIECTSVGCKPIAVTGTSCAAEAKDGAITTGQLYLDSKSFKLCIYDGEDKSVELGKDEGDYFVSIDASLFGITLQTDHFIVVNVDSTGNIKVVNDNVRYRYVIEDEYLIHKKPETIPSKAGICENVEKIFEYVLDNYTEGLDENVAYYVQQKTDD
ncbi:hypothetical protein H8356DRAFT_1049088 [Neocallimastix lanati (nom. inval.)]|nr:hypothetical protein H8356DRAFT_1049088 [Neocallimastix sp. JGI-2020a]